MAIATGYLHLEDTGDFGDDWHDAEDERKGEGRLGQCPAGSEDSMKLSTN